MLQLRFTVPLNPLSGVTVTVDVAEPPAEIVPGERGVAESWNVAVVAESTVNFSKALR
jgi:hypothetical protein